MRPLPVQLGALALLTVTAAAPALAQREPSQPPRETPREAPRETPRERTTRPADERWVGPLMSILGAADRAPDRAVIGVTLGEAGTRGIRVEEVAPNGPAAQAGIRAGDYLTAVGDVSLRLPAADLEDPVLRTTAERRLRRALERADAGDEVTLRVATGDAERVVRLRTVRADRLEPARADTVEGARARGATTWGRDGDRATLGLSVTSTGTARDTLGAFVMSVVPGSPAERAGIYEGARIAAVNGVDLRVDRADVADDAIAAARAGRLEEQLRRATAGDEVTLRVYDDGRFRDVRVRTARASEVYPEGMRMLPGGLMRPGPGASTIFRLPRGGTGRTFVVPEGRGGRFEIVTPEGRREGVVPRVRAGTAPRLRIYRDGDAPPRIEWEGGPDVWMDADGLDALEPEVRERVERRLEETRRRLRDVEERARTARPLRRSAMMDG